MISQNRQIHTTRSAYLAIFVDFIVDRMNHLPFAVLMAIALCFMGIDVILRGPDLLVVLVMAGCTGLAWNQEHTQRASPSRRSFQRQSFIRRTVLAGGWGMLLLMTWLAYPAQAQFFGSAETWMQGNFGANTGDAIPLVFNVLRGLFLLYVGISLVRVINSARQDEDWQTIARTPLIIIIAVTAGDILTTLITG